MKKTTTAILLSALVIPGAGHLYLKNKLSGFVLMSITIAALYVLVMTIIEKATLITDKILNGNIQPDITAITELVRSELSNADTAAANVATIVFAVVWLIGIADSYRLGKKTQTDDS